MKSIKRERARNQDSELKKKIKNKTILSSHLRFKGTPFCHCEEHSDVAISGFGFLQPPTSNL